MSDIQLAKDILWRDCIKAIMINSDTGAYEVLKGIGDSTGAEERLLKAKNIFTYMQGLADEWLIHGDDIVRYLSVLRSMLSAGRGHVFDGRRFSRQLRYLVGGQFIWVTLELLYPADFGGANNRVLLCIRRADNSANTLVKPLISISDMALSYIKVLRINPERDSYEVMKLPHDETTGLPESKRLSDWFASFAKGKNVHPDDISVYSRFTDLARITDALAESHAPQKCKYRRRGAGGSFRWVSMELVPCVEFTPETPLMMLYIRDINDEETVDGISVPDANADAAPIFLDELTGLKDESRMNTDISAIGPAPDNAEGIGVMRASLNGLPYVMGAYGANSASEMIRRFRDMLTDMFPRPACYHLGFDEFAVIRLNVTEETFGSRVKEFRSLVMRDTPPIASIGSAWERSPDSVRGLLDAAYDQMAIERGQFRKDFPERAVRMDEVRPSAKRRA